jgi:hypothetical protein
MSPIASAAIAAPAAIVVMSSVVGATAQAIETAGLDNPQQRMRTAQIMTAAVVIGASALGGWQPALAATLAVAASVTIFHTAGVRT